MTDYVVNPGTSGPRWSFDEERILQEAVLRLGANDWESVAQYLRSNSVSKVKRTHIMCECRWQQVITSGIKRGHWTAEEDCVISDAVDEQLSEQNIHPHSRNAPISTVEIKWSEVSKKLSGLRTGKQCRERYSNHLDPTLKKSAWSSEEDIQLIQIQLLLGNSWTKIAMEMPGRSENEVKNRWYSVILRRYGDDLTYYQNLGGTVEYTAVKPRLISKKRANDCSDRPKIAKSSERTSSPAVPIEPNKQSDEAGYFLDTIPTKQYYASSNDSFFRNRIFENVHLYMSDAHQLLARLNSNLQEHTLTSHEKGVVQLADMYANWRESLNGSLDTCCHTMDGSLTTCEASVAGDNFRDGLSSAKARSLHPMLVSQHQLGLSSNTTEDEDDEVSIANFLYSRFLGSNRSSVFGSTTNSSSASLADLTNFQASNTPLKPINNDSDPLGLLSGEVSLSSSPVWNGECSSLVTNTK